MKESIIEIIGISLGIIGFAITIPMYLKMRKEWKKENEERKKGTVGNSGEAAL